MASLLKAERAARIFPDGSFCGIGVVSLTDAHPQGDKDDDDKDEERDGCVFITYLEKR